MPFFFFSNFWRLLCASDTQSHLFPWLYVLWIPVLYFQSRPAAKPQAYIAHTFFANSTWRPDKHRESTCWSLSSRYSPDSSLSPSVETLFELLRPTLWASFLCPTFFLSYFWSIFLNPCNIFWLHLQNTPRICSVSALSSCHLLVRIAFCQVLAGTVLLTGLLLPLPLSVSLQHSSQDGHAKNQTSNINTLLASLITKSRR